MENEPSPPRRSPSPISFKERLRRARKERGRARESDEDEPEDEPLEDEGATVLHKLYGRRVTFHPGNIAKKSGKRICLQEADALRIAEEAGLPVPHVHHVEMTADGKNHISMDYIEGQVLSEVWPTYSEVQKRAIIQQLLYFTYNAPACQDEQGFNEYLMGALMPQVSGPIRRAFEKRWRRTDHRVVFTHSDVAPRNIIVRDDKVVGLIDWEDAGWYPEYWEYVKFFQRSSTADADWKDAADEIFPQAYPDELVDYIALSKWLAP
ncbi:uncharacterized protein E0L32_007838 [Thyridium curvatum]|uniref:Aminoglycoside phosphotransferase domain-containing protein n=1 Tax=Thyridium curvatum TaxID=1093900 RepID=A0A507B2A0_9PEZI|nr:uncharacterized protein E0L32_007838 [Thyridium curvatum]TPX11419.1 hypothetical protein E0L32_007838 [Thyridium curvatum]